MRSCDSDKLLSLHKAVRSPCEGCLFRSTRYAPAGDDEGGFRGWESLSM